MSELSRVGAAAAAPGSGLFGWYRELDTKERRTLKARVGGWALDAMDAQIYAFVIPALISVGGITRGDCRAVSFQAGLRRQHMDLTPAVGAVTWITA